MKPTTILLYALAAGNTVIAAADQPRPKKLPPEYILAPGDPQEIDSHLPASMEKRDVHTACVYCMATCIAGYGLLGFVYKQTVIAKDFFTGFSLCGIQCVSSSACAAGNGVTPSESTQIFNYHQDHGLVNYHDCENIQCDIQDNRPDGTNSACEPVGCGPCDMMAHVCRA